MGRDACVAAFLIRSCSPTAGCPLSAVPTDDEVVAAVRYSDRIKGLRDATSADVRAAVVYQSDLVTAGKLLFPTKAKLRFCDWMASFMLPYGRGSTGVIL